MEGHEAGEGQRERPELEGEWSKLEGSGSERQQSQGLKLEGHEVPEGQCEWPKLEVEQLMLEGPGLKFEEARGEQL